MGLERTAVIGSTGPEGPPGPQGETGLQGEPGEPGAGGAGSVIRTGDGPPSDATGADTDIWIDRLSGALYRRDSGVYVFQLNIKGPPGEAGEPGAPGTTGAAAGTYPVSGLTLAWVSGRTFRIGAGLYYLDGTLTSSAEQEVTLDPADDTFPRIDVFVMDAAGVAGTLTGTPAATPAEPTVDPATYLRVSAAQLPAAATDAPITTTPLYAEGDVGEWSASASAGTVSIGSTSNPRSGSKDIEGTNVVSGTTVTLTKPSTFIDLATQEKLILYPRIKAAWPTKKAYTLRWLAGTVQKGATVTVGNGLYGLNTQLTGAYQQVVVPLSAFSVPAGSEITKLEVGIVGSGASVGFYLDDLALQAGAAAMQGAPFRFRGEWSPGAGYDQNDTVTRTGSTYICLVANSGKPPCWNSALWTRFGPPIQIATTIYIDGASGNDALGVGTITSPYATLARALAQLPDYIYRAYVLNVADGTYAEGLDFSRFICAGSGSIKIEGDVTTPANVTFTGTVTVGASTIGVYGIGPVRVELEGIRVNATASVGVVANDGARVTLDRCTVTGTLGVGVQSSDGRVDFQGDVTISGWSTRGIGGFGLAKFSTSSAGTLTVTGPGSTGIGIHLGYGTQWFITISGVNITVTGVLEGFHCGINATFQHIGASGTITIDNVTTPGSSFAVQTTDSGGFATSCAVVIDHFTTGFWANSNSFIEYESSTLTQSFIGTLELETTGGRVNAV